MLSRLQDTIKVKDQKQGEYEAGSTFRSNQKSFQMRQSIGGDRREGNHHVQNMKASGKDRRD